MTDYLLVPMQPTPNGRMHIGHGGGTYLRADIAARFLTSRGHSASIISGSDAHENWVLAESARIGLSPAEVCRKYHGEIAADLGALEIELDVWIDPLADEHVVRYRAVHERALARLESTGAARLEEERVPVSGATGEVMVGTWIAGQCPSCGADAGGNSCVKCGDHFQPEELLNPRARLDDSPLEWLPIQSWFAHPLDEEGVLGQIVGRNLRDAIAAPALRYVKEKGGRVRLSGGGSWGITSDAVGARAVLMNSYYLYSVYCGEVYQYRVGSGVSPFSPSSDVVTVGFFGTDNTTPGVVVPAVIAQGSVGQLKPFDFTVLNGMLNFEGQKCSTSKRHGIWISEILGSELVSSDELRFALAHARLDFGPDDITLQQLADRVTYFRGDVVPGIRRSLVELRAPRELGSHPDLSLALERQAKALSLDGFDTSEAVSILREWVDSAASRSPQEWLIGCAILAYPIAPRLGAVIWAALGLPGQVAVDRLSETLSLTGGAFDYDERRRLSEAELLPFVQRGTAQ